MKIENFINIIDSDFYTGVPDSQLKSLCDFLIYKYGTDPLHHIIAANEGNAVALAAGYYLSTKKYPVVYMQNSGEGNAINPMASLMDVNVYGIPAIYVIGWRGEPGVHDEPQHVYQGKITCSLLELMNISYMVVDKDTTVDEMSNKMTAYFSLLSQGKSVAFVIKKGALVNDKKINYTNDYKITRESVIETIIKYTGDDPIVSTTGKASRELFELREKKSQGHQNDFLTVGSMGHASSIALAIAINKPAKRVWCIDGDGALLMHMGAMTCIGSCRPKNLVHIVINNESHETVGGMPTNTKQLNLRMLAEACGYQKCYLATNLEELNFILNKLTIENNMLSFVEVKASIGARADLGRPTTSAHENMVAFMKSISSNSTSFKDNSADDNNNPIESYEHYASMLKVDYSNNNYESVLANFIRMFKIRGYGTTFFNYVINSLNKINSEERFKEFCEQCCTKEMALGDQICNLLNSTEFKSDSASLLFNKLINLLFSDKNIIEVYCNAFRKMCSSIINREYIDIDASDKNSKYIMLSGTGWSGSGAVRDYLKEFENVEVALGEWPIFEDSVCGFKGVINNIHDLSKLRQSAVLLIFSLLASCKFQKNLWMYRVIIPAYKKSHSKKFSLLYARKYSEICYVVANVIIASYEENIELVKKYLHTVANKLIELQCIGLSENTTVLIDNCIHLYNMEVLEYCTNIKLLGVVRDPRSNYVARINECPAFSMSAEAYANKVKKMLSTLYSKYENLPDDTSKRIKIIRFEDFILSEEFRRSILDFLDLSNANCCLKGQFFKPNESIKNVFLHNTYENQSVINTIYNIASEYCFDK